jgi:hypothetical protein
VMLLTMVKPQTLVTVLSIHCLAHLPFDDWIHTLQQL